MGLRMKGGFHGMSLLQVQKRGVVEGTNRWEIQTEGMRHQCCVSENNPNWGTFPSPNAIGSHLQGANRTGEE